MAKKRNSRRSTPLMLLWSRQEQRRFIDAVERLVSTIGDLQTILAEPKRRAEAAAATRAARQTVERAVNGSLASGQSVSVPIPPRGTTQ